LADMVVQEGPPGLVRRPAERAQEARDSALGNGDTEHLEFAINSGCAPQRIGGDHLCDQSAEFCSGARATSTTTPRLGKPSPESPEPLALPPHNRVWLDVEQRLAPVARQTPEGNPKHPVQGRQQRTLSLSLKDGDLHSERRVFDGHGLMAAKKQSNESKDEQQKHWPLSNPSYHDPSSSTGYERIEYWRSTRYPCGHGKAVRGDGECRSIRIANAD